MFEFGKSLMTMNPEDRNSVLKNATGAQRNFASEMGIGMNGKYGQGRQRQQQRQQKRSAFHDLDRLNHVVEKENEAHDFFGACLVIGRKVSPEKIRPKTRPTSKARSTIMNTVSFPSCPRAASDIPPFQNHFPRSRTVFSSRGTSLRSTNSTSVRAVCSETS